MAVIYKITNTTGVDQFSIQEGTFDGPGGFQAHTNLQLHGYGYKQWGEKFDNNFYKLLENFACPQKVSLPIEPQGEADLLGVGSGTGIDHPVSGQTWYNTTDNNLYVFDGANWTALATTAIVSTVSYDQATADARFVNVTGDTMTGPLMVSPVAGVFPSTTTAPTFIILSTGGSGNARIDLGSSITPNAPHIDFHSSGTASPGGHYDVRLTATGGNSSLGNGSLTVSGNLFASNHPTSGVFPADNLKVATKLYVDNTMCGFPSGTTLPFYQAAAPTGWTQNVSYNDYMLRVVNTAGGGIGGSDSPILNNKVAAHTHTFSDSTSTTGAGGAHTHNGVSGVGWVGRPPYGGSLTGNDTAGSGSEQAIGPGDFTAMSSAPTHTHTISVSGTTATNTGALNWTPKYLNIIIATKS